MMVQTAEEDIENIDETVKVGDAILKVSMERLILRCYRCGHVRVDCLPLLVKAK